MTCCNSDHCCGNGECCAAECEGCHENGELTGGTVTVDPLVACIGETITFAVSGVTDSGGVNRVNCSAKEAIPPATPIYTWTMTIPANYPTPLPPLSGAGDTATVVAKVPGPYTATFQAEVDRDCAPQRVTLPVATAQAPDVTSVEWVTHPGNTALDACPNNGGKRIFPDKSSAGDASLAERPKVDLVAHISPVVGGCQVHFKVWDVDDPFDQNNPGLANVTLIDSDTSGPDNRGSAGGPMEGTTTTDATGKAVMTFAASMQPGDNFRASGAAAKPLLDAVTQTDADGNQPPSGVKFSTMLTVWRKLHVELDSMGPVTGNQIVTAFTNIVGTGTTLTEARGINTIDDGSANLDKTPPGNGRFENGTFIVGTGAGAITISPIDANGNTSVVFPSSSIAGLPFSAIDASANGTMSGTITQVAKSGANFVWSLNITSQNQNPINWPGFVGGTLSVGGGGNVAIITANSIAPQLTTSALNIPCTIHDDDDDTLLPKIPDTTTMAAAYQPAYVVPVYDVGDNNMNVPFVLNVAANGAAVDAVLDWDSRSLNAPSFWVAYVLQSYQGQASDEDSDADAERDTLGMTPSATGGSVILLEIHQAHEGNANPTVEEQSTVVHESGHAVGNSDDHPVTGNNDNDSTFVANYLAHIRSSTRPSP